MIIVYTSDNSIVGKTPPDITKEGGGATPGPKVLRPCPLVSISSSPLKNKMANLGSNYTITLNGYLLVDGGSPGIKDPDVPENIKEQIRAFIGPVKQSTAPSWINTRLGR